MANYNSNFTGQEIDAGIDVLTPKTLADLGLNSSEFESVEGLNKEFLLKLSVTINSGNISYSELSWVPASNN